MEAADWIQLLAVIVTIVATIVGTFFRINNKLVTSLNDIKSQQAQSDARYNSRLVGIEGKLGHIESQLAANGQDTKEVEEKSQEHIHECDAHRAVMEQRLEDHTRRLEKLESA